MHTSINLRQFKSSFDNYKDKVSKVPLEDLTFFWFDDFYDGMLSGMLGFRSRRYRFEIVTDYEKQIRPRVFAIIELTKEQVEDETYWHHLFEEYVGCHSIAPAKDAVIHRPKSQHRLFYEPFEKRKKPNYMVSPVIAWYEEEKQLPTVNND